MVKEIRKANKPYFECEECNFIYKDKKIAGKCEEHCKRCHSCNMEITEYAIKL